MKIEIGKKYKTRNGKDVRIYAVDNGGIYPTHGAIKCDDVWCAYKWDEEGRFLLCDDAHVFDLVEVKEDWEILVEAIKSTDMDSILVLINGLYFFNALTIEDTGSSRITLQSFDGLRINPLKSRIKLATLEDCKQHILEK